MSLSSMKSASLDQHSHTFTDIVDNSLCIGCGVCTLASAKIEIGMNNQGFYRASLSGSLSETEEATALAICPFSNSSLNEDQLSQTLFPDAINCEPIASKYITCNIISQTDEQARLESTSSGFTTWLLTKLLESGDIDGVIHVGTQVQDNQPILFNYVVSRDIESVRKNSKTKYYPVELSEVLASIQSDSSRYAVVGLPCFIKALQNLRCSDSFWKSKIVFCIAIFCGHLKSSLFTDNIIRVAGLSHSKLIDINYRKKSPSWSAANYITEISTDTTQTLVNLNSVTGGTWNTGGFKYFACNFCDDILGETADVSIGDAWMEPYRSDWRGTNNVIIRNSVIENLVRAMGNSELEVTQVTASVSTYGAAGGGIADRRDGLSYRLMIMDQLGQFRPKKRVAASASLTKNRRNIIALKMLNGMLTSYLYPLSVAARSRLVFLLPTFIIEIAYRLARRGVPMLSLPDILLRLVLRFHVLPR